MIKQLEERLAGFQELLRAASVGGRSLSSSVKGTERERFVQLFLARMFPPSFRFGTGEVVDQKGDSTGQLDVVIELPFLPSFPFAEADTPRLYFAEGVAAAIEVKSNVKRQWKQVVDKASKVAKLERKVVAEGYSGDIAPPRQIPFFVVGYRGWSRIEDLESRVSSQPVAGILVLSSGGFVSAPSLGGRRAEGPAGLLEFLSCVWTLTATTVFGACDPREYVRGNASPTEAA